MISHWCTKVTVLVINLENGTCQLFSAHLTNSSEGPPYECALHLAFCVALRNCHVLIQCNACTAASIVVAHFEGSTPAKWPWRYMLCEMDPSVVLDTLCGESLL